MGDYTKRMRSTKDLLSFVNRVGECYLFTKDAPLRVFDLFEADDVTTRRGLVLEWCEEAHLGKELFLSVDERGSLLVMSMERFGEEVESRARIELTDDEGRLLEVLERPLSTPELRKVARLPRKRFDRALTGLRFKMRIALVDIRRESSTKHVNRYDRIERWHR